MRKARHRAKLSVAGRFSKKPGLVTTMGKTKFIRSLIRQRATCNDGCRLDVNGTLVGTWSSASPLEIPLIFSKPITVDWDDDVNPSIEVIQPGERVVHHYSANSPPDNVDAPARLGTIAAGAGGAVNPRNIRISFSQNDSVILDYDAAGGYFSKHLNNANGTNGVAARTAHINAATAKFVPPMDQAGYIDDMKQAVDTITSWGGDNTKPKVVLKSLEGASNLTNITANDTPRLFASLKNAFKGATNLVRIDAMNNWKTTFVTDMEGLFEGATKFLGARAGEKFNLDTTSAKSMKSMFKGAAEFNVEFGNKFKTENVETMESMFEGAAKFNKAINFNTPKLGTGAGANQNKAADNIFKDATDFDQDVSSLDFRNLVAAPKNPFAAAKMNNDANKKPVAGEKKAIVKDGIVLVGKNIPFFFEGQVAPAGSFANGYVGEFYSSKLSGNGKAFDDLIDNTAQLPYVSIVKPGATGHTKHTKVNYNNNRILAIEVRHTDTTDTPISQKALDDANVYIYFSKPVTLNSVKISDKDSTNLTTHTVGAGNLDKISLVAGATDNAGNPFTQEEKDLVKKGIGGVKPHGGNLTVYRLTGVNHRLFGNTKTAAAGKTTYANSAVNGGIKVVLN